MIDELRAMAIFAETAKQGSFRAAAKALGLSPSVVSYHISRLEKATGTPLLYRTTRSLSLTHEGQLLFQSATQMLNLAQSGLQEIAQLKQALKGNLVVTLPTALTHHSLTTQIASFKAMHPDLNLSLLFTDLRQDLVADGIDLAIRAGSMADSSLKSKRLGVLKRKLVCSASFYRGHKVPNTPFDVGGWPWIHLSPMPLHRVVMDPEGQEHTLKFAASLQVNSVEAMSQLCLAGYGVATPPDYLVADALDSSQAVEICPDWRVAPIPLYAVWPNTKARHAGVRALLDFIGTSGAEE